MESLAEGIDEVEECLNEIGTVTAKAPDIWGESRLTKHRQEIEKELATRIDDFELLLNASISRTDQAYLASALAIGAAVGSGGSVDVDSITMNNTYNTDASQEAKSETTESGADGKSQAPNLSLSMQVDRATTTKRLPTVGVLTGDGPFAFASNSDAQGKAAPGISLEPTIVLDQLSRYMHHLQELRRLNEGGDTADAPGYSLNLVRIPVSVLPGDDTRCGHGASITVTARSHLSPELLPTTFRSLVVNDLVDQLGLPLTKAAERIAVSHGDAGLAAAFARLKTVLLSAAEDVVRIEKAYDNDSARVVTDKEKEQFISRLRSYVYEIGCLQRRLSGRYAAGENAFHGQLDAHARVLGTAADRIHRDLTWEEGPDDDEDESLDYEALKASLRESGAVAAEIASQFSSTAAEVSVAALQSGAVESLPGSTSRARTARYAVPPSQIPCVFGEYELLAVAETLARLHERECDGTILHLSDTRAYLSEELQAAYDFLASPAGLHHWDKLPAIVDGVRSGAELDELRASVTCRGAGERKCESVVRALAWAILVESALLNEKLNRDVRRVSHDPECGCTADTWHAYYGPTPDAAASETFLSYVECRWPIHVFALDPVVQEQNVSDFYSMRREMQLAMALAFSSGRISANSMTQYMRRLEMQMETVALNKTAVAFGHGRDTFGWRFYPRVQTPDIEGNVTVAFRDLLMGGPNRDQLLANHRLEPGMREVTALVIMPSFVNHVQFDTRGHFFELTDPDDVKGTMKETLAVSRCIRQMQETADFCLQEENQYRHGELARMLARVRQLSQKMPLQTLYAKVPNENTIGGFEMFSSGVTDLSPELIDYYGRPGVDPTQPTRMFLVGKNFSVHDTRVIAGNRACDFRLLSREIMEVVIPPGVQVMTCTSSGHPSGCGECVPMQIGRHDPSPLRPVSNETSEQSTIVRLLPHPSVEADPEPQAPPAHLEGFRLPLRDAELQGPPVIERFVDVHIATPYGVTQHLHVPVVERARSLVPASRWSPDLLAIAYRWKTTNAETGEYAITNVTLGNSRRLLFPFPRHVAPSTAEFNLEIGVETDPGVLEEVTANPIKLEAIPYDVSAGGFVVNGKAFLALHRAVLERVKTLLPKKGTDLPKFVTVVLTGGPKLADVAVVPTSAFRIVIDLQSY